MTIKVTIPNTSSDSLTFGSANTPTAAQVVGIDSGSSNGQLAFNTTASGTSTERMRIDTSGNVGIGTSSPASKMHISASYSAPTGGFDGAVYSVLSNSGSANNYAGYCIQGGNNGGSFIHFGDTDSASVGAVAYFHNGNYMRFDVNGTERARIDPSGNLLVGTTSVSAYAEKLNVTQNTTNTCITTKAVDTAGRSAIVFTNSGGFCGQVATSGSTTSYITSSDYRLKNTVESLTGALTKVSALKPVTYKWNADGNIGEGFIAHELAEVCPSAVYGEKDAVDEEGNPVYQGIDTSFLVATLTAAIQEQQALISSQAAAITTLTESLATLTARTEALEAK